MYTEVREGVEDERKKESANDSERLRSGGNDRTNERKNEKTCDGGKGTMKEPRNLRMRNW